MTELTTPPSTSRALKAKQQATWASGDYAVVGTTLQIVGERLCETIDLRAGSKVLDVAAGNGNATLAAARRFCEVTSTDYVPALLERGRARAAAERQAIDFRVEDAEALSFPDASFDVVLSTFGVMFTADHGKAAAEMLRVCKPGGTIAMANWTPEGFIGQVFKTIGRHLPPPPGREVAGALGHPRRDRGDVRRRRALDRARAADLRLPLPLARALHRGVPHLVRPDPQGLPGARRQGRRARGRPQGAARRHEHRAATAPWSCPPPTSRS